MRNLIIMLCCASLLIACGGKKLSGKELGTQVCDCSKKANAMDAADPKRATAQADCQKEQVEAWNKVKDDEKKAAEFNKVLSDCASEQIKKSFGQ